MTSLIDQTISGYVIGTWDIDAAHSEVSFTVRHLMVSKVRGHFARYEGTIEPGENVLDSQVAVIAAANSRSTTGLGRSAGGDSFRALAVPTR
ncbi:MAG: YceI family protein [Acidimicrobiia bacterium]